MRDYVDRQQDQSTFMPVPAQAQSVGGRRFDPGFFCFFDLPEQSYRQYFLDSVWKSSWKSQVTDGWHFIFLELMEVSSAFIGVLDFTLWSG